MSKNFEMKVKGRVGRDPELRFSKNGKEVTNFSLAVDMSYKPKGSEEWIKRTIWFRVTCFGANAGLANDKIKKGAEITVVGDLDADWTTGGPKIWKDRDGNPKASYEMVAWNINFGEDGDELPPRQIEDELVDEELPF